MLVSQFNGNPLNCRDVAFILLKKQKLKAPSSIKLTGIKHQVLGTNAAAGHSVFFWGGITTKQFTVTTVSRCSFIQGSKMLKW